MIIAIVLMKNLGVYIYILFQKKLVDMIGINIMLVLLKGNQNIDGERTAMAIKSKSFGTPYKNMAGII